jgi:hypothetical protein
MADDALIRERIASVPSWYHRFELAPGSLTGARALLRCAVAHDERRAYFLRIAQGSLVPGTRSG